MKKITTLILSIFLLTSLFSQTTHTVNAGSYYYNPTDLIIELGDSVVWINEGGFHDVNGNIETTTGNPYNNPETFDSPPTGLPGNIIFAYKFTIAGTYNYDCSVGSHAANGMVGSVIVDPGEPTAINNVDFIDLQVFPNPSDGEFIINMQSYNGDFKAEVFDIMGRSLIKTNNLNFSLKQFPSGLYLLRVDFENSSKDIRLIKN